MKKLLLSILSLTIAVSVSAQTTFTHPWQGATVAYLGDSISDPGERPDGHDWTGRSNWHYWGYLQEWLGIRPYVYAISGQTWKQIPEQADRLKAEHGSDFDAITIFMGANDYITDIPIGEWYDYQPDSTITALGYPATKFKMVRRTPAMTDSTLCGRINIGISKLKSMYPDKQIVIFTPIHRAYGTFGANNIHPNESFPNHLGIYFQEYVDAVKEAGNVWGVPVIDLNSVCGINPMVEEQVPYFCNPETDRLHPNAKGHERIARTLMYQLLALPCKF